MKTNCISVILMFTMIININAKRLSWTYTTQSEKWVKGVISTPQQSNEKTDVTIYTNEKQQKIEGFGACFNELGWEALLCLQEKERTKILNDLFTTQGMNFTLCRMPLGSNDYSFNYYSYNDVPEDFEMKNFSIDRDRYILIPYIKAAKKIRKDLKIWASPWCPPIWMKVNNHYAMGVNSTEKTMVSGKVIANNATAFKMENRYLNAYALYFSKFIQAYKKEKIEISRVMVQNEPIYQPHWQSCTWRPDDLAFYIGNFLGPQFQKDSIDTEIWLGTVNSADPNFTRTVLGDKDAVKYIKGIGMQWDAKNAIPMIHKEYPNYQLMQTESECGNGENNWKSAEYTWSLINQYINNGANSYMYWNMILDDSGKSTWGWKQNMLIAVNKETGLVTYNPEYYLMKHLSHFVLPGAVRLKTSNGDSHLAFINPDGAVVLIFVNKNDSDRTLNITINEEKTSIQIKGKSFNSFTWNNK